MVEQNADLTRAREISLPPRPHGHARPGKLNLAFASTTAAQGYVLSLTSLFHGTAKSCLVLDQTGRGRDDLDLGEIAYRIRTWPEITLHFRSLLPDSQDGVVIALSAATVTITIPLSTTGPATTIVWLQADPLQVGPLPILALPVRGDDFTLESLHALVALGVSGEGFVSARYYLEADGDILHSWSPDNPGTSASLLASTWAGSFWFDGATGILADSRELPSLWYGPSSDPFRPDLPPPTKPGLSPTQEDSPEPGPLPSDWWSAFDDLVRVNPIDLMAIQEHLQASIPQRPPWRLEQLAAVRHTDFMAVPADDRALILAPRAQEVIIGVDPNLPAETLQPLLLHALAHLALGHVRPGDVYGHWDSPSTATAITPHRLWDQQARDYVADHLKRPTSRRIESLDDCTPTEKAQLGVWRMIGEMLGESRRLHPVAERYQKAAYQRQAAQRLVAMLEDYGGAMLCDGVGLGKTYVATTLVVHYANGWRDQHASTPEGLREDHFRITILAPNSVVSTWRREALPQLAAFGLPLAWTRVISHTKLSRLTRASELLDPVHDGPSDLEHLLLSDLVIVDEAHNFRSLAARRTKVLRDLLRLQPRRETRRRVVLLTATPVNNSLDDLRQESSLLFSRSLYLSAAKTDDGYRRQALKEIQDRCERARRAKGRGDVAGLVIHGQPEARFSDTIEFRDDLDFGANVQRIGDYLREQDQRLRELQAAIRATAREQNPSQITQNQPAQNQPSADQDPKTPAIDPKAPARIAEELLDRIVVQRSRALCKEIERQQASRVELLFRPDAGAPEKLYYADEYDGIADVLARFLPLFDRGDGGAAASQALSLKVYMWYDVREGLKGVEETSSVVGLQRVLVLKRLESSPVAFLITLLRLTVLHAHRLRQLEQLCLELGDNDRRKHLGAEVAALLAGQEAAALEKIRSLATGESPGTPASDFLQSLSAAYSEARPAAETDDAPLQLMLFEEDEAGGVRREQLDRLWDLRTPLLADFATLLQVTPDLADIVFGRFARAEWPRRFIAGGDNIDWPTSTAWGLRLVTDGKIRQLISRLLLARRAGQKVIVFSQFSDTIAYIRSVLSASRSFARGDWQMVLPGLGVPHLKREEIDALGAVTVAITGDTDNRDDVVNAFAPFYRIGPWRPATDQATAAERAQLLDGWETAWGSAMARGVDVLLSSDVLAEGVNLQDAALLVNYDVHWNPVRMIQRSGRIDRRLNPRIEQPRQFPDLTALATRLGTPAPRYYWHDHPDEAPVTVNMILPDALEAELQLRERIATKTLAIDFTLGLEQGTGAEADWMESYKYHGVSSLNSFQKDRAIEQIASHHEQLARRFAELGIQTQWVENLNGWFRTADADHGAPLIARALLGRPGGELERFQRYLRPAVRDGIPYWFWAEKRPGDSMFDGWLTLDGRTWPPPSPRRDLPWDDEVAGPLKASHLLTAVERLGQEPLVDWSSHDKGVGRLLLQGASAIAAPKFGEDRDLIRIPSVFILQLQSFDPAVKQGQP